jgi:hypothetical protein
MEVCDTCFGGQTDQPPGPRSELLAGGVQHDPSRSTTPGSSCGRCLSSGPPGQRVGRAAHHRGSPALAGRSLRPAGGRARKLVRPSHLAVTWGDGWWREAWPRVKRRAATVLCDGLPGVAGGACGPVFPSGAGVGDGQGQGFELGDEGAELAVVVEPLPVVVGDEPGDGLAGDLAGPLPVGAVQDRGVGVAAAAGLAAPDVPLDEGAGQGEPEAG